jgi:hypothetical protein
VNDQSFTQRRPSRSPVTARYGLTLAQSCASVSSSKRKLSGSASASRSCTSWLPVAQNGCSGAINIEGDLIRRAADKKNPEALRVLRTRYVQDAKSCHTPVLCAAYFAGLSYIGTTETVDVLHGALSNADESLRVSAIRCHATLA